MNVKKIIEENNRRLHDIRKVYDPETGEGSNTFPRVKLVIPDHPIPVQYIPEAMYKNESLCKKLQRAGSIEKLLEEQGKEPSRENLKLICVGLHEIRIKYDFEYYAYISLVIQDKITGGDIPFKANRGQRRLLKELERLRMAGKPIRIILLKARQWGGSTLTQLYFLWIQLVHVKNWSSIICAHKQDAARNIRGMFERAVKNYPETDGPIQLTPYQGTQNIKEVKSRGCRITVGSAVEPDSVRSQSGYLVHFSEVAFFPRTDNNKPEELIGSVSSIIPRVANTAIVYESTAKGIGNFFHTQWLLATEENPAKRVSIFVPVFVEWFLIDIYSEELHVPEEEFIKSMSPYEWWLFNKGATLQAINWYRGMRGQLPSDSSMKEEYPSDDVEAFQNSGQPVFDMEDVENLRKTCKAPIAVGELTAKKSASQAKLKVELRKDVLKDIKLVEKKDGCLKIWEYPEEYIKNRYVVFVDTGGRGKKADYSVVTVFDRYWMMYGDVPVVVAQWRGHVDHDILVWMSAQIATYYGNALLVFESNTHETDKGKRDTDGDHTEFIFDTISQYYDNLYSRTPADKIIEGVPPVWGFHMNRSTKTMVIDTYTTILRENGYIERDEEAVNEARWFEKKENGSFGAIAGKHDDVLITRMAGLHICYELPLPVLQDKLARSKKKIVVGESTF